MKVTLLIAAAIVLSLSFYAAQAQAPFDANFTGKALRFDVYQTGDAGSETLTIDAVYEEPLWPETRVNLVDPFRIGRYMLEIYDVATNALLYSRGFDTMFAEYKTTTPALEGVARVFQRSLRIPEPPQAIPLCGAGPG